MSLGKKLFIGGTLACTTDTVDKFADSSGVALYSLDYDASDASGNYNGTANSNVTFGVDGQINYGADFTGGGVVAIPNNAIYGNNHSISAWFKLDNTSGYQGIFDFDYNNRIMFRVASSDANEALVGTSGWFAHNINFSANQWYHLVITFSNGNPFKIYVDGSVAYTGGNSSLNAQLGDNNFGAGNAAGVHSINGNIDQLRIFSKELSASEVSTLYAETACVYTSTTDTLNYQGTNLAYYKLDNNANDETTNYDGAESNITYEFGRFGQSAVFNDSAITTSLNIGRTNDFTISFWVKDISDSNYGSYDYKWVAGVYNNDYIPINYNKTTGKISLSVHDGTTALGDLETPALDDNWHHIVFTQDVNVETKLYLDGVLQTSETISHTSMTQRRAIAFGTGFYFAQNPANSSNDLRYRGKLDQVRIYNSALDAAAVQNLYNEKPEVNTSNFETVLYKGNGGSQYISNVGFQPDLVWIKSRGINYDHQLHDSVREAGNGLLSNSNVASVFYNTVTSFDSNGFFVNAPGTYVGTNANNQNFVAWCWKGGGDAIDNTNGNITSQVSANQDAGFSIVKYTGNGSVMTIGHGLSSAPELIIFKSTNTTQDWLIATTVIDGSLDYFWDATAGFGAATKSDLPWSVPDSSVINFGSSSDVINNLSGTQQMIAYCFHSVAGYQKVGSYTGGGSSGKTVTTGFRPSWVMIKRTDVSNYWVIIDSKRDTTDPYSKILWANVSDIEADGGTATAISFSDTGFSMSTSVVGSSVNATGGTYIYLAIA